MLYTYKHSLYNMEKLPDTLMMNLLTLIMIKVRTEFQNVLIDT